MLISCFRIRSSSRSSGPSYCSRWKFSGDDTSIQDSSEKGTGSSSECRENGTSPDVRSATGFAEARRCPLFTGPSVQNLAALAVIILGWRSRAAEDQRHVHGVGVLVDVGIRASLAQVVKDSLIAHAIQKCLRIS